MLVSNRVMTQCSSGMIIGRGLDKTIGAMVRSCLCKIGGAIDNVADITNLSIRYMLGMCKTMLW